MRKVPDYDSWKCTEPEDPEAQARESFVIQYADDQETVFWSNPENKDCEADERALYELWCDEGEKEYDEMKRREAQYFAEALID